MVDEQIGEQLDARGRLQRAARVMDLVTLAQVLDVSEEDLQRCLRGEVAYPSQPEQWGEAEAYVQFGLAGTGPVAAVVEPLPEILAEVVPSAPGREGGGHGVLAGAAGQNGPADPQYQAGQLWPGEVR